MLYGGPALRRGDVFLVRAERRRAERSGRSAAPWAAVFAFLVVVGCLNLDLPTLPQTPPAPSLQILTPKNGDTINLTAQVSVAATSVDGIASVSVLCGPLDGGARTIYTWTAAPYVANVNFTQCQDLLQSSPTSDAGLLQLAVQAFSNSDAGQQAAVQVYLNTAGPQLTIQYPPTAQPKAPYSVTVTSSVPLQSFPIVTLGSVSGQVTATADAGTYLAFFAQTPGLGTDNYAYDAAGPPVPIEVLTDTEEMMRLTVTATAASSGNTTEVDLGVDLNRVVWDRFIPGQPASSTPLQWAAQPVAFSHGLELPLSTTAGGGASGAWLPGVLGRDDGIFYGFNPAVLDGGYIPRGLNALGETLAFAFDAGPSTLLLAPAPNVDAGVVTAAGGPATANAPLSRVDNLVCLQDSVTGCSLMNVESLTCFTPQLTSVTASSGLASTGPPTPGVVAGAGGRYLSPNVNLCGSSWNLVDLNQGTVSFGPTVDVNGCTITAIDKLLAVGDGTFVVQLTSDCSLTAVLPPVYPIYRVGPNSTILGAYTAPAASPSTVQAEVVAALPGGKVVTLNNAPPYTNFELWSLNATAPDVITPIAGLYDTADNALASVLAESTYSASDGSFAVLLSSATLGVGVLAFGPNLQPLWLYVYPRVTDPTSSRLVSAPSVSDVYLVDTFNNFAVSLRVAAQPVAAPDGGFTVAGTVVNSMGTPLAGEGIVVLDAFGTANATSGADGGFSVPDVVAPYTLSAVDLPSTNAVTYEGLTISNPVIQLPIGGPLYSATLNVTVVDGGVFPQPAFYSTYAAFVSPQTSTTAATTANGTATLFVNWGGPVSTTGGIYLLQSYLTDGGTLPVNFTGYGTLTGITLKDGATVNVNVDLSPVSTGTLSGTVTPPAGGLVQDISVTLVPDGTTGNVLNYGYAFYETNTPGAFPFSFGTPAIPGTTLLVQFFTDDTLGNSQTTTVGGLDANTANLSVAVSASPVLETPPNGTTGVTTSTSFSCTSFPSGIYHFSIGSEGPPTYNIWSASPAVTMPDLSSAGLAFPNNASYSWHVQGYAPLSSVDELARPPTPVNSSIARSLLWDFSTAP